MDALRRLPGHLRQRLTRSLMTGELGAPYSLVAWLNERAAEGLDPDAIAFGVRCFADGSAKVAAPTLVWSGPEVAGLHARDTRRVYEELFREAEESVWVSTFVVYDGPSAFEELAKRMDGRPELEVRLFLNLQRKWGDETPAEILVSRFAKVFWQRDWPGTRRPTVYFDPRSLALGGPDGVLHAKGVVVDNRLAFITSANLTEAAWDRNIELGVVVQDPPFAQSIVRHFERLVEEELLQPLPK
jgi:phosphatidylserine/phosphatidylglycerophosphate/cardiolipin synthase-like enzyme